MRRILTNPLLPAIAGAALLLSVLGACGFHLQGRLQLPPVLAAAWIDPHDSQSDFYLALRAALRVSGTTLPESATTGAATIRILQDELSERVLTVSAQNIPTAYELTYSVRFSVSANGAELIAPETQAASREYSFDEAALLAKDRERETLAAALADELAARVMRRLASL
jgi:LPS-assembly lipoprotein